MDDMNPYKRGKRWWLRFRDHQRIIRRLRATKDRRTSDTMALWVGRLVDAAGAGQAIPDDVAEWVMHSLDAERREKLIAWGLVSPNRLAAGESLAKQIAAWRDGLQNRGRPAKYYELRHNRAVELLVTACGFGMFRDIDAEAVQAKLADWKRDTGRSDYTRAHYLSAAKAFTRWMVRNRRASSDPLLTLQVVRGKAKKIRRALTDAEQAALIAGVVGTFYGIDATARAMLYRVALGTGLRAGAIRRLTVADVDPRGCVLLAKGSGADNKHSSAKPLPSHLADALAVYVDGLAPEASLFPAMPDEHLLAKMLRHDCEAAGVVTAGVDFHALRHTFGTTMARRGVHPRTLMALMDHHSIQLTMRLYVHSIAEDERAAVDMLPDLGGNRLAAKVA